VQEMTKGGNAYLRNSDVTIPCDGNATRSEGGRGTAYTRDGNGAARPSLRSVQRRLP